METEFRGMGGDYNVIVRRGKMHLVLKNNPSIERLITREVLGDPTNDSEWLYNSDLIVDIESKKVEKSRFF